MVLNLQQYPVKPEEVGHIYCALHLSGNDACFTFLTITASFLCQHGLGKSAVPMRNKAAVGDFERKECLENISGCMGRLQLESQECLSL